jgi:hypothetical protein
MQHYCSAQGAAISRQLAMAGSTWRTDGTSGAPQAGRSASHAKLRPWPTASFQQRSVTGKAQTVQQDNK